MHVGAWIVDRAHANTAVNAVGEENRVCIPNEHSSQSWALLATALGHPRDDAAQRLFLRLRQGIVQVVRVPGVR